MGKYGSPDLKIEVANSSGTMKDLSEFVTGNVEVGIEGLTEEAHGFGDEWVKNLFTGVKQGNEISLEGFYDDAAEGPDDVLNSIGDERKVKITYDGETGSKYTEFMAVIRTYVRRAVRGELHKFTSALLPTGEFAEDEPLS